MHDNFKINKFIMLDDFNENIKLITPKIWIILLSLFILIFSLFIWSTFGVLETKQELIGIQDNNSVFCIFNDNFINNLKVGDVVKVNNVDSSISNIFSYSDLPDEIKKLYCLNDLKLPDNLDNADDFQVLEIFTS